MRDPHSLLHTTSNDSHDPTEGAARVAYREILGEIPSTEEIVTLQAWVIIFKHESYADSHFDLLEELLGEVDVNGHLLIPIAGIPADRAGNMSPRTDLIGTTATIWITATNNDGDARGAILTSLDGLMIQLLAVAPYESTGQDRAVYLLERIASQINTRQTQLGLTPENDTASRLPILDDVIDTLQNAKISVNRYG